VSRIGQPSQQDACLLRICQGTREQGSQPTKQQAGVLFCCKQEGRVNHEAMKIITKDPAATKRGQNNNHRKIRRVAHKRPKAKPTRPTGRTPMMMLKPARFQVSRFSSPC